jgi:hypothetical protein
MNINHFVLFQYSEREYNTAFRPKYNLLEIAKIQKQRYNNKPFTKLQRLHNIA